MNIVEIDVTRKPVTKKLQEIEGSQWNRIECLTCQTVNVRYIAGSYEVLLANFDTGIVQGSRIRRVT